MSLNFLDRMRARQTNRRETSNPDMGAIYIPTEEGLMLDADGKPVRFLYKQNEIKKILKGEGSYVMTYEHKRVLEMSKKIDNGDFGFCTLDPSLQIYVSRSPYKGKSDARAA